MSVERLKIVLNRGAVDAGLELVLPWDPEQNRGLGQQVNNSQPSPFTPHPHPHPHPNSPSRKLTLPFFLPFGRDSSALSSRKQLLFSPEMMIRESEADQ